MGDDETKLKKRKKFHPQTYGHTDVVNMTMVHFLQGYCSKHPKLWDEQFHYVQHAYNHAMHSYTQKNLWNYVWDTCRDHPWIFLSENQIKRMENMI
jgi:hypothetical protein